MDCADLTALLSSLASGTLDITSVQEGVNCTQYYAAPGGNTGAPAPEAWPTGVEAVAGNNKVTLNWVDAIGATSYRIYWQNSPGVTSTTATLIDDAASGYVHNNLTNSVPYYYVVTAMIDGVESKLSTEVNATPSDQRMALTGLFADPNLQAYIDTLSATKG